MASLGSVPVYLNGYQLWAWVVELDGGYRVRVPLDDWQRLGLHVGQRVPVRLPGRADQWLFVEVATDVPPVTWLVLSRRLAAVPR